MYRPPSVTRDYNIKLGKNIENACLENKEQIVLRDFNNDFLSIDRSHNHDLVKTLKNLNLTQVVNRVTRPISNKCLDHIFTNSPDRILKIFMKIIGLSGHLPIFPVHTHKKSDKRGLNSTK